MRKNLYRCYAIVTAILLGASIEKPVQAQLLDVVSDASVSGTTVRLVDVISNADSLPAEWESRVVAAAPAAGQSRLLALADVAAALHPYEDMHQLVLRGQTDIRVTGKAVQWDADQLDEALERFLSQDEQWEKRRFSVFYKRLPALQAHVQTETLRIDAIRPEEEGEGFLADIVFCEADTADSEKRLSIPLMELRPYWAIARPVLRGAQVNASDVEIRWLPVDESARCYPADQPIVGMEAKRNLQTSQVPRLGMLAAPFCARKGEIVRVQWNRGGLTVTLRARALSDGRREDSIACVNERSGRRMHVRLTDMREAVLEEGTGS